VCRCCVIWRAKVNCYFFCVLYGKHFFYILPVPVLRRCASSQTCSTHHWVSESSIYRFINVFRYPISISLYLSALILPLLSLTLHPGFLLPLNTRLSVSLPPSGIHSSTCLGHLLAAILWKCS
jgi:hypothetical protein